MADREVAVGGPKRRLHRKALSKELQVEVYRRDRWLCRWCGRPVIFAPAMKYLERYARARGYAGPLAWSSFAWRRDASPLLDHLGAVIDHVMAFSTGGAHDASNFATACAKCNIRKSAGAVDHFQKRQPLKKVKGKYGEPEHWDGFSVLFVLVIQDDKSGVTRSEMEWYEALVNAACLDASDPGSSGMADAPRAIFALSTP
jgi:5-methylcytosine-specific restriction endonuclease McrA